MQRVGIDTGGTFTDLVGLDEESRIWRVEIDGVQRQLCSIDCEDLYRSCWVPTYGNLTPRRNGNG